MERFINSEVVNTILADMLIGGNTMKQLFADMVCTALQKKVFSMNGKKPKEINSFSAPQTKRTELPGGALYINDLCYDSTYPNSFLDIWRKADDQKLPVIVYFHGGGMLFGDKVGGDPLAAGSSGGMFPEWIKNNFAVVSVNYALAPKYRCPVQIQQAMKALCWLQDHGSTWNLDMERVIIMGSSAGANITLLLGQAIVDPAYAKLLGMDAVIEQERIKALIVDESALSSDADNKNLLLMAAAWLGEDPVAGQKAKLVVVQDRIAGQFIPTFINASNVEEIFYNDALRTARALDKIGAEYELFYRTKEEAGELPHGFLEQLNTNEAARACFDAMLTFALKHTN